MKKINLRLYKSYYPPEDINVLWGDIDEASGNIKCIYKYNKKNQKWEPYVVSPEHLDSNKDSSRTFIMENKQDITVKITRGNGVVSGTTVDNDLLIQVAYPGLPDAFYGTIKGWGPGFLPINMFLDHFDLNHDGNLKDSSVIIEFIIINNTALQKVNVCNGTLSIMSSQLNSDVRNLLITGDASSAFVFYKSVDEFEESNGTPTSTVTLTCDTSLIASSVYNTENTFN